MTDIDTAELRRLAAHVARWNPLRADYDDLARRKEELADALDETVVTALLDRLEALTAENAAQAARIKELEAEMADDLVDYEAALRAIKELERRLAAAERVARATAERDAIAQRMPTNDPKLGDAQRAYREALAAWRESKGGREG